MMRGRVSGGIACLGRSVDCAVHLAAGNLAQAGAASDPSGPAASTFEAEASHGYTFRVWAGPA